MEPTKLIQLSDGMLLEVSVKEDEVRAISGSLAEKVNASFQRIRPVLVNACRPLIEAWQDLSQEVQIDQAEIELGLSFEGEGNLYITKSKAAANIAIKIVIKPRTS